MTLKNTILLAGILMAAVSCSLEDDLIPAKNNGNVDGDGNKYAFISAMVNDLNTTTKAGGDSELLEETISNTASTASLILFNADETNTVFWVWDGLDINTAGKLLWNDSPTVQIKVADDIESLSLKAMVVANTTQTFTGCADSAAVVNKIQAAADLTNYVKVSPLSAAFDLNIETTLTAATANPTNIPSLTVTNIGAVIQFIGFENIAFVGNTLATDVYIQKITVNNLRKSTYTQLNEMDDSTPASPTVSYITETNLLGTKLWDRTTGKVGITETFQTFANIDNTAPISMTMTLAYDGKTLEVPAFVINRPSGDGFTNDSGHDYVRSGNIYQVQLNAQLKGEFMVFDVRCYTQEWKYNRLTPVDL